MRQNFFQLMDLFFLGEIAAMGIFLYLPPNLTRLVPVGVVLLIGGNQ